MTVADAPDRAAEAGVAALETRAVRVVLGDLPVLRGVSLSVPAGTRLGLVGPNGAGKSTLLRVVAGLLRPESGEVVIHGRALRDDPWHARRAVGVVGHLGMLHPDLTLRENLASFANLYGLNRPDQRADEALQAVGLQDRAHSQTRTLSRGMLQRLALARATLHNPSILLLDEPETGLDARAHEYLTAVFARGAGRRTAVIASHDLGFIRDTTDEVAFLRSGTVVGRVETAGLGAAELRERYADALARPPAARSRQRALRHGVVSS